MNVNKERPPAIREHMAMDFAFRLHTAVIQVKSRNFIEHKHTVFLVQINKAMAAREEHSTTIQSKLQKRT